MKEYSDKKGEATWERERRGGVMMFSPNDEVAKRTWRG